MNKYTTLFGIVLLVILSGCSTFSRPEKIVTQEVLIEKIPLDLESPRSFKWKHVDFIVITPENYEEKLEELKKNGGSKALYAVNTEDYQKLSLNIAEMLRYMKEQKLIILQYKEYYEEDSVSESE